MKSFKISQGIIDAMVEAKLDPTDFFEFMSKYGEFIKYGLLVKKIQALGEPEFDTLNVVQALSTGINCFEAFTTDFYAEYQQKSIEKPAVKKE